MACDVNREDCDQRDEEPHLPTALKYSFHGFVIFVVCSYDPLQNYAAAVTRLLPSDELTVASDIFFGSSTILISR